MVSEKAKENLAREVLRAMEALRPMEVAIE
jgi:hypothetical protein